jgi:hypothetical protein
MINPDLKRRVSAQRAETLLFTNRNIPLLCRGESALFSGGRRPIMK